MRILAIPLLFSLLCACSSGDILVHQASTFDRAFDSVLARYYLPGLAVGVIEDGEVVYVRTSGELEAGRGDKLNADSLFKIASNSKAMTVSVLARLVDAGKLNWEDPVVKHLPQFRMFDPWVGDNMEVRDLLVHNSGLPAGAGDLMLWPEPNAFTRDDIISGLAFLKPDYGFRSGYAYDNLLYEKSSGTRTYWTSRQRPEEAHPIPRRGNSLRRKPCKQRSASGGTHGSARYPSVRGMVACVSPQRSRPGSPARLCAWTSATWLTGMTTASMPKPGSKSRRAC